MGARRGAFCRWKENTSEWGCLAPPRTNHADSFGDPGEAGWTTGLIGDARDKNGWKTGDGTLFIRFYP